MAEYDEQFRVRYSSSKHAGGHEIRSGEFELTVSQEDLPEWLRQLNLAGGQLLEVKPLVDLEAVFFNLLESKPAMSTADTASG